MSSPFDDPNFEEEINPANWTQEGTRLHTPTFEALLKEDGTLWLSGPALAEGFSVEAAQALTRFLSERVQLPPVEPPYDFAGYTPKRVDTEREVAIATYQEAHPFIPDGDDSSAECPSCHNPTTKAGLVYLPDNVVKCDRCYTLPNALQQYRETYGSEELL
jgi:hypothetical protein